MSTLEDKYLKEFGKSFKNFRLKHSDKSLRLLAYECGIAPSILSRLENGQRMANLFTLKKLALGLNMDVGTFLIEVEKNIPDDIKNFDV